jgi:hypothetical protein
MRTRDQIMLLGDSITQLGFRENGFAAQLAGASHPLRYVTQRLYQLKDAYIRKLDVINRGMSML